MELPSERALRLDEDVLDDECRVIAERRRRLGRPLPGSQEVEGDGNDAKLAAVRESLVGLTLSGGGIRSAMFGLGVVQAFEERGMMRQVDYLVTVSGGSYVGAYHALMEGGGSCPEKDMTAQAESGAARTENGKKDAPWSESTAVSQPHPLRSGVNDRQPEAVLRFLRAGQFLNRPISLALDWGSGFVLNLLTLVSFVVALCAGMAWLARLTDMPTVSKALTRAFASFLAWPFFDPWNPRITARPELEVLRVWLILVAVVVSGSLLVHWLRPRQAVETARERRMRGVLEQRGVLALALGLLLALSVKSIATAWFLEIGSSRALQASSMSMMEWLGGTEGLPAVQWGITDLDRAESEFDRKFGDRLKTTEQRTAAMRRVFDLQSSLELTRASDSVILNRHQVQPWARAVAFLLDSDPRLTQRGLEEYRRLLRIEAARDRVEALKASPLGWLAGLIPAAAASKQPSNENARGSVSPAVLAPRALAWFDLALARLYGDCQQPHDWTILARDLHLGADSAVNQPVASPAASKLEQNPWLLLTLVRSQRKVTYLTQGIVHDLSRAFVPALLLFLMTWAVGWAASLRGLPNQRLHQVSEWLHLAAWVAVGVGVLVVLGNGDTEVGFVKLMLPNLEQSHNLVIRDPDSRLTVPGARLSARGILKSFFDMLVSVPTFVTAILALIPLLLRDRFFRSAEMQANSLQGKFFRMVVGGLMAMVPILGLHYLAAENVSGYAPTKAMLGQAQPGDPDANEPVVARMGVCSNDRYLVQNDQSFRMKLFLVSGGLFLVLAWVLSPNTTSVHQFYRDQVARAFLLSRGRAPRRGSDFCLAGLETTRNPLLLISGTLSLLRFSQARASGPTASDRLANFVFTPRHCGSRGTGYTATRDYLGGVPLADAVAVSGAAISPTASSSPLVASLMWALNMRLGQWYPSPLRWNADPETARASGVLEKLRLAISRSIHTLCGERPNVLSLASDVLLWPNQPERRAFCYLSDGAHYDSLGIELLLERRCRMIIVADVSEDPDYRFEELAITLRRVRARHGIQVVMAGGGADELSLEWPMVTGTEAPPKEQERETPKGKSRKPTAEARPSEKPTEGRRFSRQHFLMGRILYPEETGQDRFGLLIVLKPSVIASDSALLVHYYRTNALFPHDPNISQSYEEDQANSYRELGRAVGVELFNCMQPVEDPIDVACIERRILDRLEREQSARKASLAIKMGGVAPPTPPRG